MSPLSNILLDGIPSCCLLEAAYCDSMPCTCAFSRRPQDPKAGEGWREPDARDEATLKHLWLWLIKFCCTAPGRQR
eukprot:360465-Chlamydomonas_euryale.AAC.3